jgi:hypothetical protein
MNRVYKLKSDISEYKVIPLDIEEIAEQLDALGNMMDFLYMGIKKNRLAGIWGEINTDFEASPLNPGAAKIPNVSVWGGSSCLVLSERAHAVLRLMLEEYGEFLPITVVGGFTYYIFNNLTDVEPDMEYSSYVDEEGMTVQSLVFDSDAQSKLLFKSNWEGGQVPFCNQQFKDLCEEFELGGLIFSEDLI